MNKCEDVVSEKEQERGARRMLDVVSVVVRETKQRGVMEERGDGMKGGKGKRVVGLEGEGVEGSLGGWWRETNRPAQLRRWLALSLGSQERQELLLLELECPRLPAKLVRRGLCLRSMDVSVS